MYTMDWRMMSNFQTMHSGAKVDIIWIPLRKELHDYYVLNK